VDVAAAGARLIMICNAVHTGRYFLSATLANVDCQAQAIGAYGYGALSDPASSVSIALTLLLTVFIALFGLRLLLGHALTAGDLITDALRVGIVLALATSWPAWRVVGYDLVFNGPAEIANAIGLASGLPGSRGDLRQRLQDADNGIVAMTVYGSGRLTGGVAAGTDLGDSTAGIAVADGFAFGMGRTLFLSTTIGSFALVRIGAGVLLALAPLMAGLLLFTGTMGVFVGWARALAFCALANAFLLIVQGADLALLYPWISDVLAQREGGTFALSAPTELLVLCLAYTAVTLGVLYLTSKLAFNLSHPSRTGHGEAYARGSGEIRSARTALREERVIEQPSPAQAVAGALREAIRREERSQAGGITRAIVGGPARGSPLSPSSPADGSTAPPALGSSYKRASRRVSGAAQRRDRG
jgi:type IV secretion system protein VirB6